LGNRSRCRLGRSRRLFIRNAFLFLLSAFHNFNFFPFLSNHRNRRVDRNDGSLVDDMLKHDAAGGRLHFHGRFVGFDFGEHIAFVDGFAHLLHPADQQTLRHVEAEFGHIDGFSH